jgi:hypothetical protein
MTQLKLSNELDELLIDKLEVTKDFPVQDKKKFNEGGEWKVTVTLMKAQYPGTCGEVKNAGIGTDFRGRK